MRRWVVVAALLAGACGQELKLGSSIGMEPITGETYAFLNDDTCEPQGSDCLLSFERDVVIATKQSYVKLDGLVDYVKAVDLGVRRLELRDGELHTLVKPEGTVTLARGLVLNQAQLQALPQTLRLEGETFEPLRRQIRAGQSATLHVVGKVRVHAPLPGWLVVRYDVLPVMIIGEQ